MSRGESGNRDRVKFQRGFQNRLDGLARSHKDHHVTGMRMENSGGIRKFLVEPVMHLCLSRNISIPLQFVAQQVADQDLIRLKLPVPSAPAVTWCDTDRIPHSNTDIPTGGIC